MFRVIADKLGGGMIRNDLDAQHVRMMTTRNGIVDGTKCQASERQGNLFSLACIAYTANGLVLKEGMEMTNDKWKSFLLFIRQYLALEEWFHAENDKEEMRQAHRKIARVLKLIQDLFPQGDGTNGYNIPKMYRMAKMQYYMVLFGCGINFFGGPGESSHKEFVKAPGMKTQRRIGEFAVQTARQYHHVMVTKHVETCLTMRSTALNADETFNTVVMEGKYKIDISDSSWEDR